jgi:hypothetical protein
MDAQVPQRRSLLQGTVPVTQVPASSLESLAEPLAPSPAPGARRTSLHQLTASAHINVPFNVVTPKTLHNTKHTEAQGCAAHDLVACCHAGIVWSTGKQERMQDMQEIAGSLAVLQYCLVTNHYSAVVITVVATLLRRSSEILCLMKSEQESAGLPCLILRLSKIQRWTY